MYPTIVIVGMLLILLVAAYLYFACASVPNKPQPGANIEQSTIRIADRNRSYLFYIPKKLTSKPALIIALHGTGMNALKMRQWTAYEFDQLAD